MTTNTVTNGTFPDVRIKNGTFKNGTLLVLNISPELEEDLVDYLLGLEGVEGFTSYQVYGHGEHGRLSLREQVTGRRRRMQYEIMLPDEGVAALLQGLAQDVGTDVVYWQHPLTNFGRLS